MKYLGIDYGKKKVGLAISDGKLAEPMKVIRYVNIESLAKQIKQIIEKEKIEKVIVGVSEGEMAKEILQFLYAIRYTLLPVPCEIYDETLSTQEAISLSIQGGIKRKKRKSMEDAYAATIMLQNYLDNK